MIFVLECCAPATASGTANCYTRRHEYIKSEPINEPIKEPIELEFAIELELAIVNDVILIVSALQNCAPSNNELHAAQSVYQHYIDSFNNELESQSFKVVVFSCST